MAPSLLQLHTAEDVRLLRERRARPLPRRPSPDQPPDLRPDARAAGARVASTGGDEFIRRQLSPETLDDGPCDAEIARFTRLRQPVGALVASNAQYEVQNELVGQGIVRAVRSRRQLLEVMVDFWTNHLSVNAGKFRVAYHLPTDNATFRRLALGPFDALLSASAKSLSMLTFLDNRTSRADGVRPPNENYARELLEIHTLGDPSAFSEADVEAIAHVFTGWTIDTENWTFAFRGDWNRLGPAATRETLGWRPVAPDGDIANGESLLAHLARHPLTARNLAHKLCRHFIRDDIDVYDGTVQSVAESYLANGTDLRATLSTLFASEAFRGSAGSRVKRPSSCSAACSARAARASGSTTCSASAAPSRRSSCGSTRSPSSRPRRRATRSTTRPGMDASSLINRWNLAFRVAANRVRRDRHRHGRLRGRGHARPAR